MGRPSRESLRLLREARDERIRIARQDVNAFIEYVGVDDSDRARKSNGGRVVRMKQHAIHEEMQRLIDRHRKLVLMTSPETGKAYDITTQLPTPAGWVTMGDIDVGDTVFGSDGNPCTVIAKSPVFEDRKCFRVKFHDGGESIVDAEHQWITRYRRGKGGHRVVTTQEMLDEGLRWDHDKRWTWMIPVAKCVQWHERELPIPPYVLGLWLGDGSSWHGNIISHNVETLDYCESLMGAYPKRYPRGRTTCVQTFKGLSRALRENGLKCNKHIPDIYMMSSPDQRMELLKGLLDSDGYVDGRGKRAVVEFSTVIPRLASQVTELARSLGFRTTCKEGEAKLYGRVTGPKFRVCFTAHSPVFRLKRKLERQTICEPSTKSKYRQVIAIEPVPSVPVKCITVDSPDSSYIIGRDFTVTHNSSNIALRLLWEIGRNPDIRILIASKNKNPEGTGAKAVKQLRSYIQTSQEFHEVFPEIRPALPWKEKIFCVKRKTQARESTVQLGSFGDYVKGSRFNIIFLDDWYDEQSAESPTDRNKLMRWIETLQDRLLDDGRMIVCCNAIHPDDPAHRIERLALEKPHKYTWVVKRFPVYEPPDYDIDLAEVTPINPVFWPIRRIRDMKNSMSELEFRRLYLCSAIDESGSAFHNETVARAFRPENEPGGTGDKEFSEMPLREQRATGCQVVVGVDFGAKQHARADKTVLTAVAYYPRTDTRQVLWIESGRWRSDVVAQKIIEFDRRFRPATIMLETSGQQEMIFGTIDLQMKLYERDADPDEPVPYPPCQGYNTTAASKWNKVSGVELISSQISAGRWIFPAIHPDGKSPIHGELAQLKAGMVGYVRGQHTADHLMSLWLANEGIRLIAYSEEDDIEERETERAMILIDDLLTRHPTSLPDDFSPVDLPEYLKAWEALEDAGVDMSPYSDDYYALTGLLEELEESDRPDEEENPFIGVTMGG